MVWCGPDPMRSPGRGAEVLLGSMGTGTGDVLAFGYGQNAGCGGEIGDEHAGHALVFVPDLSRAARSGASG
jgi:hypothetical protein